MENNVRHGSKFDYRGLVSKTVAELSRHFDSAIFLQFKFYGQKGPEGQYASAYQISLKSV